MKISTSGCYFSVHMGTYYPGVLYPCIVQRRLVGNKTPTVPVSWLIDWYMAWLMDRRCAEQYWSPPIRACDVTQVRIYGFQYNSSSDVRNSFRFSPAISSIFRSLGQLQYIYLNCMYCTPWYWFWMLTNFGYVKYYLQTSQFNTFQMIAGSLFHNHCHFTTKLAVQIFRWFLDLFPGFSWFRAIHVPNWFTPNSGSLVLSQDSPEKLEIRWRNER